MKTRKLLRTLCLVILAALAAGTAAARSAYLIPQIADGRSGSLTLSTHFSVHNPGSLDASVTLRFYRDSGSAWTVSLVSHDRPDADGARSSTTFTLAPLETAVFFTQGAAPLATGWARVESNRPLIVSAGYTAVDSSVSPVRPLWEVGVLPSACATKFSFEANVSDDDAFTGVDVTTAYALVNPNDYDANVTVTLHNRIGKSVGTTKSLFLPGGSHQSRYLTELFNDYAFSGRFHGTVRFNSNVNVSVVALRQSSGAGGAVVLSTLSCLPDGELKHQVLHETEPNGTYASSQFVSLPAEMTGTINSYNDTSDIDTYQFTLTTGDVLTATILSESLGAPLEAELWLYRADNVVMEAVASTGNGDPRLRWTTTATGIYYLQVRPSGTSFGRDAYYRLLILKK